MKEKSGRIPQRFTKELFIILFVLGILITVFASLPLPGGDDWETFRGASQRILTGSPLYGEKVTHAYYSNPPWVALLLIPFSLFPFRWGWAFLVVLSFFVIILLCRHWRLGILKTTLALLSPAMFYLMLHGEIDAFTLAGVLLPQETWFLVAATKPQVAVGLILGVRKERLVMALGITLFVVALSFLFFGLWPLDVIQQPTPFVDAAHNLWAGLWPFQLPAGLAVLLLGVRRKDEKLLIAASPFLSPYAATSSLLGPWIALTCFLSEWETMLVFIAWWGAVLYRLIGL